MTADEFLASVVADLADHSYPDYIKDSPSNIAESVRQHAVVVVEGDEQETDGELPVGCSKVGGCPDLPTDLAWPTEHDGQPLAFIAQLDLAEVAPADLGDQLPKAGMLWVFSIADGDRAYGYEIDDSTTKLLYRADPGPLARQDIPADLADDEDAAIGEYRLRFGPALCLTEVDEEEGVIESKRYDGSIETAIDKAAAKYGGCSGAIRLLGHAHFFREENQEDFDIETDVVLLAIDGYAIAQHAFGEGELCWLISKKALAESQLETAWQVFEPGT